MSAHRIEIVGEYSFTPLQLERVRDEGLDCRPGPVMSLMARRSPEAEPGVIYTPYPSGVLVVSTTHRRGELLVVVAPPIHGERIMYRPDREGG